MDCTILNTFDGRNIGKRGDNDKEVKNNPPLGPAFSPHFIHLRGNIVYPGNKKFTSVKYSHKLPKSATFYFVRVRNPLGTIFT